MVRKSEPDLYALLIPKFASPLSPLREADFCDLAATRGVIVRKIELTPI